VFFGSAFHTDESRRVDNLFIMGLSALAAHIHIILPDSEIRLEFVAVFGECSSGSEHIPGRFPESESFIDADICFADFLEKHIEILRISMERIEIFHQEFSSAKDSGLRPCLVPEFGLELVHRTGIEILVRFYELLHKRSDDLLMRRIQSIVFSRSPFHFEEIVHTIPSTGFFPVFASPERTHKDFRTSDRIKFFSDNLLDVFENSESEMEIYVRSRHLLADESGLKEESRGTVVGSLRNGFERMERIAGKLEHNECDKGSNRGII